jgi:hypothetical protein
LWGLAGLILIFVRGSGLGIDVDNARFISVECNDEVWSFRRRMDLDHNARLSLHHLSISCCAMLWCPTDDDPAPTKTLQADAAKTTVLFLLDVN